ncbi:hypothetical protein [Actinoplanes solisilvae]|uniref:hypothetical protein n=1 Tax=Actinoplanes solisilvae TaxID=2486853 RepID=UPI000FD85584|nr:hypothetical protein [Actinoplanes solisilvae]
MINPVTFPRAAGTTATYLHPLLQSSVLQSSTVKATDSAPGAAEVRPPTIPAVSAVTGVQPTAAYADALARDAATAMRAASLTAKTARGNEKAASSDPVAVLARQTVIDHASSQVGMLLTRAAAERRVAVTSGLPASRLAAIDTTTSRLYHALDVLV